MSMEADRPSADVVAANVINGVMLIACGAVGSGVGVWAFVQLVREFAHGGWPPKDTVLWFVLMSLFIGPRFMRRGLVLIRKRASREAAV